MDNWTHDGWGAEWRHLCPWCCFSLAQTLSPNGGEVNIVQDAITVVVETLNVSAQSEEPHGPVTEEKVNLKGVISVESLKHGILGAESAQDGAIVK